jgi:Mce-associated membrane protein
MTVSTRRLVAGAVVVLTVAAIAVAGFLGYRYYDLRQTENARDSSLAAAKDYATTMFGYTPQNVEDHVAQSQKVLTGAAKPTYDELVTKNNLVSEVRKQQVVSEAAIQDAGVVTNTADTSTVLIFMNQSVTRGGKDLVRVDPSRLTFTMVKRDDQWLIEGIDVITDDSFRSRIQQTDTPPPGAVPLPNPAQGSSAAPSSSAVPSAPAG